MEGKGTVSISRFTSLFSNVSRPNIIVVVMDTARFDVVSDSGVMPTVNEIARTGCRFTNTFANAPWTLPSHSSIFSGKRCKDHNVVGKGDRFNEEDDLTSLLRRNGYATAAFSNNPWISPDFGFDSFDRDFACWKPFRKGSDLAGISQIEGTVEQLREVFSNLDRNAPFTLANALYMRFFQDWGDSGASRTTKWIKGWIDEVQDEGPFFAFANYMEPHLPYTPPKSYAKRFLPDEVEYSEAKRVNQDPWAYLVGEAKMTEKDFEILRSLYKAELFYLDEKLGDLLTYLTRRSLLDETAIIILGDHGENLGDHGLMDHQYSLRDSLLRVPLIIHNPSWMKCDTDFEGLVELRDLFPTILEMANIDHPNVDSVSSRSLEKTVEGGGRDFAISEYPVPQPAVETLRARYDQISIDLSKYDRSIRSIRTQTHRYLQYGDGAEELYKIIEDGDTEELIVPQTDAADDFRNNLEKELGRILDYGDQAESDSISPANREHLEDLGYL